MEHPHDHNQQQQQPKPIHTSYYFSTSRRVQQQQQQPTAISASSYSSSSSPKDLVEIDLDDPEHVPEDLQEYPSQQHRQVPHSSSSAQRPISPNYSSKDANVPHRMHHFKPYGDYPQKHYSRHSQHYSHRQQEQEQKRAYEPALHHNQGYQSRQQHTHYQQKAASPSTASSASSSTASSASPSPVRSPVLSVPCSFASPSPKSSPMAFTFSVKLSSDKDVKPNVGSFETNARPRSCSFSSSMDVDMRTVPLSPSFSAMGDDSYETSQHSGEQYPCMLPGCPAVLGTKRSLADHVRTCKHKVTGQSQFLDSPEPGSDSSQSANDGQSRHRLNKNTRGFVGIKYPCSWRNCGKVLATPKSLKDHLQIHAERDAGIQLFCPVPDCGKVFGTNRCLRAHELRCKQVKSGERLSCPYADCKATFGSTDYVRRHVLDHEKGLIGVEFRCDYADCTKVLANPLTLQRHKQLHEEQSLGFQWMCLVKGCGKIYSGSKQLTDHQSRIHKNLGPNYRFACPYSTMPRRRMPMPSP
ncbi:hypothetical protein BGX26_002332 [Mortierella sp. AD094]|nr:hypothetical protein BGX26_002332 [Mortierella sp. AD094]